MRNVTITNDSLIDIEATTMNPKEVWAAVGYLSSWSLNSYDQVAITATNSKSWGVELVAMYTDTTTPGRNYVIGAVWNPDSGRFSYHS